MIETPSQQQQIDSNIDHAAQLIAIGKSTASVANELRKRGLTPETIAEIFPKIEKRATTLIRSRSRRIKTQGLCWLIIGILPLLAFAWILIAHQAIAFFFLLGLIPLSYGIYLLCLTATREPDIEPPTFFT